MERKLANGEEGQGAAANGDRYATTSGMGGARTEKRLLSGRPLFIRVALLGLIVIVAMVSIGIQSLRSRSPLALRPEMKASMTSSPGAEIRPQFSPDGKEIAFISEAENASTADLFVKLIGGDSPVRLAQNLGLRSPLAWSPDGRYIAFGRCPGPSGICIVPALGGTERKLVDHHAYGCEFQGLSWSADGKSLTLAGKPSPDEGWSIYRFRSKPSNKRGDVPAASYGGRSYSRLFP